MPLFTAPETIRAQLLKRYQRQRAGWLVGGGEWPLSLALGLPNEREAQGHWNLFEQWLRDWQQHTLGGQVEWAERRWPGLGQQRLPAHLVFADALAVATALGEEQRWLRARQRVDALLGRWPQLRASLERQFELLADSPELDLVRLVAVFEWLLAHPQPDCLLRQLPIAGIDSKWIEAGRQEILRDWLLALRGGEGDFLQVSGLRRSPGLLRLRLLDERLSAVCGGLSDLSAPVEQLAGLQLPGLRCVFVVENLQTGLAFTALPGAAVFIGCGYAVDVLGQLPWLSGLPVWYWGDLDTHGLAILHRLRCHLPQVRSLLMDEATLLAHRLVWSSEPRPSQAQALSALTPAEHQLFDDLRRARWAPNVRLEQERIGWDWAWPRIEAAAESN